MAFFRTCDGVGRRDFLKAGVVGGTGLSLASYAQLAAASHINPDAKGKAAIFVNLNGGPSHMDTFDLKPNAPSEYRGEFNPIQTCLPGVEISEHLPKIATCMDKFSLADICTYQLISFLDDAKAPRNCYDWLVALLKKHIKWAFQYLVPHSSYQKTPTT